MFVYIEHDITLLVYYTGILCS